MDMSIPPEESLPPIPPAFLPDLFGDSDLSDAEASEDDEPPAAQAASPPRPKRVQPLYRKPVGPSVEKRNFVNEGLYHNGIFDSGVEECALADGEDEDSGDAKEVMEEGEERGSDEATPLGTEGQEDAMDAKGLDTLSAEAVDASTLETEGHPPSCPRRKTRASLPGPSSSSVAARPSLRARPSLPTPPSSSTSVSSPSVTIHDDTHFAFPLPIHYGLQMLRRDRPFELSYDLLWEWKNEKLGIKKVPPTFKAISKNRFPNRGKDLALKSVCECKPPSRYSKDPACGERCLNRMMQYLCHPSSCPNGEKCTNKPLHKRQPAKLKVFWTGSRGFGLQAAARIPAGSFVIDYRGEVIEIPTYYDRCLNDYKGRNDHYALEYGEGEVIDAGSQGNIARFINHGCDTNLEVLKFITFGEGFEEYEVGFFATREIQVGEELFYDYNFDSFSNHPSNQVKSTAASTNRSGKKRKSVARDSDVSEDEDEAEGGGRQRCCCGAAICTGWIGGAKGAVKAKDKGKKLVQAVKKRRVSEVGSTRKSAR